MREPVCSKCAHTSVALVGAVAFFDKYNQRWVVEDFLSPHTVECHNCGHVGDFVVKESEA